MVDASELPPSSSRSPPIATALAAISSNCAGMGPRANRSQASALPAVSVSGRERTHRSPRSDWARSRSPLARSSSCSRPRSRILPCLTSGRRRRCHSPGLQEGMSPRHHVTPMYEPPGWQCVHCKARWVNPKTEHDGIVQSAILRTRRSAVSVGPRDSPSIHTSTRSRRAPRTEGDARPADASGCSPGSGLYRELMYPADDDRREVERLGAGCDCGRRSPRWLPS